MSELVNLNISSSVIETAIREEVNAGIVRALGDPSEIVKSAVHSMTDMYVDRDGTPCRKDSYRAIPYFTWLAESLMKDCVRTEMAKYVNEHADDFRQYIIKALGSNRFKKATAEAFIQTLLTNAESEYRTPITIGFEKVINES